MPYFFSLKVNLAISLTAAPEGSYVTSVPVRGLDKPTLCCMMWDSALDLQVLH